MPVYDVMSVLNQIHLFKISHSLDKNVIWGDTLFIIRETYHKKCAAS